MSKYRPISYFSTSLTLNQQHPARDLQDTFYISDPQTAGRPGPVSADDRQNYDEYFENVKQVHENGKYGSIGYRYPWAEKESLRYVSVENDVLKCSIPG